MGYDDFIKFLTFCLKAFNDMKTCRFWAIWFLGFLLCLSVFFTAIKWW